MHLRTSEINNEQTFISHRPLSSSETHLALLTKAAFIKSTVKTVKIITIKKKLLKCLYIYPKYIQIKYK